MARPRSGMWPVTMAICLVPPVLYVAGYLVFRIRHTQTAPRVRTVVYYNSTWDRYVFYGFIPAITVDKWVTGRASDVEIALYFYDWSNEGP